MQSIITSKLQDNNAFSLSFLGHTKQQEVICNRQNFCDLADFHTHTKPMIPDVKHLVALRKQLFYI